LMCLSVAAIAQKPYFQQEVNTSINVTLDDVNHTVSGNIEIQYINNSPDDLTEIYFLMFGNAFKDRKSAFAKQKVRTGDTDFFFAGEEGRGNYRDVAFQVDGKAVEWAYDKTNEDIALLKLNEPLKAGAQIKITTPFTLKIPASYSRLGHVGTSYQMTQWYPKPAVYDNAGWHPMPYLDMGEFYYEFGSYDVSITLPENYVVGSTGTIETPSEVAFLDKKIAESNEYLKSSSNMKTIRYTAENVHDFAWFADKRFKVQKSSVTLASGKKVNTWVMFTKVEEAMWKTAIDYVDRSVKFYSEKVGEYPYPQASAVQSALSAGGGMEYPMITVIGQMGNPQSLDEVITHEVGHNWFYGILAFNERDHVWMDEGINSYYDHRYTEEFYDAPGDQLPGFIMNTTDLRFGEMAYLFQSRRDRDQACQTDSDDFVSINYWLGGYEKPALVLKYLEKYLTTVVYDKAMQSFYEEWKFKHPQPTDYISHLEQSSGKDLSWFFDGWIYSKDDMDYALLNAKRTDGYQITVANKGQINAPFAISGMKDGEIINTKWYEGFEGKQVVSFVDGDYDEFIIDAEQIALEYDRRNNQIKPSGAFKKIEPLRVGLFSGIEDSQRTNIYALPTLGYNKYDGFTAGVGLHNYALLEKTFEFAVLPMYGFKSKDITGIANARFNLYPKAKALRKVTIGADAKAFAFNYNELNDYTTSYNRIAPYIKFDLGKEPKSNVFQSIEFRSLLINREEATFDTTGTFAGLETIGDNINRVTYIRDKRTSLNANKLTIGLEQQSYTDAFARPQDYIKATATFETNYTYAKGKNITFRFFAGGFLKNSAREKGNIFPGALSLSGEGFNEYNDYAFDDFYFSRNENSGFLSNQIAIRDGGFKTAFGSAQALNNGASNDLLIAMNFKADLPKRLPFGLKVKPYIDLAYSSDAKPTGGDKSFADQIWFSPGFMIEFRNYGAIYFPIPGLESENLKSIVVDGLPEDPSGIRRYLSRVTYTVDIRKLNPIEFVEKFSF